MSFDGLGLSAGILRAVSDQGYSEPTPIQTKAIPVILQGKDLLAGAQTGTGKTAGFTLPMLQRINETIHVRRTGRQRRPVRGLVLTPTRELAAQVEQSIKTYGKNLPIRSSVIYGGVRIHPQIRALRAGVDILVATPGRLLDHVGQGTLDLSQIEIIVLDEADRMLDMGFIHDIKRILSYLPPKRQSLLFSATFSNGIQRLANELLDQPELIEVARRNTTPDNVKQLIHPVDRKRKRELLSHIITEGSWRQVLVFTRTKHCANNLALQLEKDGISSTAIHGNKSQAARTKALARFKNGSVRALVATDVAARGLDIEKLPHVVNFELSNAPEDYLHRIGRTGRAGQEGGAISLVCSDEHRLLRNIERLLKISIKKEIIPGFEPDPTIAPQPIPDGRYRSGAQRSQGGSNHRGPWRKQVSQGRRRRSDQGDERSRDKFDQGRSSKQHPPYAEDHQSGGRDGDQRDWGYQANTRKRPSQGPRKNASQNGEKSFDKFSWDRPAKTRSHRADSDQSEDRSGDRFGHGQQAKPRRRKGSTSPVNGSRKRRRA